MKTRKNRNQVRRNVEKLARAVGRPTGFERLEDRTMLSTYTVKNTDDSGLDSLRQAILDANANPGLDTINFEFDDLSETANIFLNSGLTITDAVNIAGPQNADTGAPLVWLDGSGTGEQAGLSLQSGGSTIMGLGFMNFDAAPAIDVIGAGNTIGGTGQGQGNVLISNFQQDVLIEGTANNTTLVGNQMSSNFAISVEVNGANHTLTGVLIAHNQFGLDETGTEVQGNFGEAVVVTGTAAGSDVRVQGNTIAGTSGNAVRVDGAAGVWITGNRIGTDVNGNDDPEFGNGGDGVRIVNGSTDVHVGGAGAEGNLIVGNTGNGVRIHGSSHVTVSGNTIRGNHDDGVGIVDSSQNVITGNTIVDGLNAGIGVYGKPLVNGASSTWGNTIRQNSIYNNPGGLGIDLVTTMTFGTGTIPVFGPTPGDGAFGYQAFPTLGAAQVHGHALVVNGTLKGVAGKTYTIDVYASTTADDSGYGGNEYGEGEVYIGKIVVTADANGDMVFSGAFDGVDPAHLNFVTATATAPDGSTSEFSENVVPTTAPAPFATDTALTSSTSVTRPGKAVTFTARVTGPDGALMPTGTVQFYDGATLLGTVDVADGVAAITLTTLSLGGHTITASYVAATADFANSISAPLAHTVAKAASTTTITSSANPAVVGSPITLTATVTVAPGEDAPTGTVTFKDGDTVLAANVLVVNGVATVDLSFLPAGTHAITATYSSTAATIADSNGSLSQQVDKAATTTTVSSPGVVTVGTPVTLTATVTFPTGVPITGSVTFYDGSTPLGTVGVDANGNALFTFTPSTVASHAIKAVYSGDSNLNSSYGTTSQDVVKANSTTTIADVNAIVGTQVSLSAHVVDQFNHAAAGTIHFLVDGVDRGTGTLDSGGNAVLSFTFNTAGAHVIQAVYDGNATVNGSPATGAATIGQAASTTTVTLPDDAIVGQPTTLTAHVASGFAPLGGVVTFFQNNVEIGSGTLAADGTVSIAYTFTSAGQHTITATYAGDANHTDSMGAAATSVAKADTTVSLASSANPSVVGNSVTFTATVAGGYGDLTDGFVVFKDGSVVLGAVPVGAGNKATFTTTFLNADGHQITATFQGNANSADSESAPLNQVVNKAATTTTLTSSATSTTYGQAITFTATVGVLGSPLAATGVVRFFDGTTLLGEVALDGTQQAALTVSNLAGGAHSITAVYVGSDTHLASNSNSIAVNVTVPSTDVPFQASGHTLRDTTGNGLSADDTALAGVTVKIFKDSNNNGVLDSADALFTTVVSNSSGLYTLSINAAGRFFAQEVAPSGYLQTGPTNGYYTFTASVNNAATSLDFSNWKTCDCGDDLVNITYIINGTTHVTDLRGNTHPGDVVQVVFTVPAGHMPITVSLVSYTAPSGVWDATLADQQKIWEQQTGTFGPGTYTLTVNLPDTYYQVDFVCGPAIDKLGPVGSNIFYSAQNRLFSADNSGSIAYVDGSSSLSGFVYNDLDNDGKQDANEPGIAGVKVLLSGTDAAGHTVSRYATTDSRGRYAFANVLEGNYSVTETQPAGYLNGKETPTNVFGNVKITATRGSRTGYNFGEIVASRLSGFVYVDANNDGVKQSTEKGLAGVTLSLVNASGAVVGTTTTDSTGAYTFGNVVGGTYTILETQPAHYVDGIETAGTLGGYDDGDNNTISSINVGSGQTGANYNFGELPESFVCTGESATIGFWQNKNGQNLIKSFNGASTSKLLAKWLTQTFPNLYGSGSANNLNGKTNADVATLFTKLFNVSGQKLDAQVLAVALAVYGTTSSLGGTAAARYGFTVDAIGTGHRLYNIGSNGAAFGVANNTNMEVLDILDAANDRAVNGVLYNGNTTLRNMANTVFTGINEQGDIA